MLGAVVAFIVALVASSIIVFAIAVVAVLLFTAIIFVAVIAIAVVAPVAFCENVSRVKVLKSFDLLLFMHN